MWIRHDYTAISEMTLRHPCQVELCLVYWALVCAPAKMAVIEESVLGVCVCFLV